MKKEITVLTDDLDGTTDSDVSTVKFSVDGKDYEIDLRDANADVFREALAPYIASGRRLTRVVKGGPGPGNWGTALGREKAIRVRTWAAENGFQISQFGRIPKNVVLAYQRDTGDV